MLAGVGRAMVEKGFELMQMRGRSFFSTGRWPLGTRPKTSSKQSEGMVVPRSLVGGDTKGLGCWLLMLVWQINNGGGGGGGAPGGETHVRAATWMW